MTHIISNSKIRFFYIPLFFVFLFIQCDDDSESNFPNIYVNATVYIDQIGFIAEGEHAFVDGYGLGGLIIVRLFENTYVTFDRACTHEAKISCILEDDSDFYGIMVCPCCGSKFLMSGEQAGTIFNGPAKRNLVEYKTVMTGPNTLIIQNY